MESTSSPENLQMIAIGIVLILIGTFFVLTAIKDWDWLFGDRRLRRWIDMYGRKTVRKIYAAFGIVIIGHGITAIGYIIIRLLIDM